MKIIIVILCLLLTGCKIDYSLKITNDNKFVESADLAQYFPGGSTAKDELGETTFDFGADLRADAYSYLNKLGYSNYKMTDIVSKNYEGVRVSRKYDGPTSYNYNLLIKYIYDDFSVDVDNNIVTINAKGLNRSKVEERYEMLGMVIEDSTINVELPYKVIENNADSVDKTKNIYTWYIDKDTKEKEILLKYNSNDVYALNMKTIGTKVNMTVVYLVIIFLVLVVIGYFMYVYVKKVYENRNKF